MALLDVLEGESRALGVLSNSGETYNTISPNMVSMDQNLARPMLFPMGFFEDMVSLKIGFNDAWP